MPDGEIRAQYDPQLQPRTGAGGVILNAADINLNNVGGQVMARLVYFNTFAKGCTMHPLTAVSAPWHETVMDALVGRRTFTFASTGPGTVAMRSNSKNQYMSQTISASGHCDRDSHLVLDYHEEVNSVMTNGPPSSITRNLKLRQ